MALCADFFTRLTAQKLGDKDDATQFLITCGHGFPCP